MLVLVAFVLWASLLHVTMEEEKELFDEFPGSPVDTMIDIPCFSMIHVKFQILFHVPIEVGMPTTSSRPQGLSAGRRVRCAWYVTPLLETH